MILGSSSVSVSRPRGSLELLGTLSRVVLHVHIAGEALQ